ncbi:MAG: phosphoribulokinase [Fidelibacterota bacterium]
MMRPIMLGIVGDSATGKTTMSRGIAEMIGEERVTLLCIDNYHQFDREQRKKLGISALDPACNYIEIIEQHLELLRKGESILSPNYNHATGAFDPPSLIVPRAIVIVEGLLGFSTHAMRDQYDVKVYLDPPEELRIAWKMKRDTTKRGYTREEVLDSLRKRENVSEAFIHPQRKWSDIIIRFYPIPGQHTNSHLSARVFLRSTLAHPDLHEIVEESGEDGKPAIRLEIGRYHNRLTEFLDVPGDVGREKARQIEYVLCRHIPELRKLPYDELGAYANGVKRRHSDTLAIAQMLIVYQLMMTERDLHHRHKEQGLVRGELGLV